MDSSLALRSFHCNTFTGGLRFGTKLLSRPLSPSVKLISCVKTTARSIDIAAQGSLVKNNTQETTIFPSGFEALMHEVCDETEVAELKLKVGDFEMHLKRSIAAAIVPVPSILPTIPSPTPTVDVSPPVAQPSPPSKPSAEKTTPFTNVSFGKTAKLAALEASGVAGYFLVASPTVGSFRRNRTVKGKKQPPILRDGDVVKEGQVIGYLEQLGGELPVKSDVAGEVVKLLFDDGDAVGYGDPLIAVSPSFHNIKVNFRF